MWAVFLGCLPVAEKRLDKLNSSVFFKGSNPKKDSTFLNMILDKYLKKAIPTTLWKYK